MIQCKKDGFGVRYGAWRAATGGLPLDDREKPLPDGWRKCEQCGKPFKPYNAQKYCQEYCQHRAALKRAAERDRRAADRYNLPASEGIEIDYEAEM